ncbi:MAG: hypothetical protein QG597_3078 [Actinomycetota bacterium]|nr:hypothetical protein [Actinomycetota bacterium]
MAVTEVPVKPPTRVLVLSAVRPVIVIGVLLVVYWVAPIRGESTMLAVTMTACVGLVVFGGVFVHQVRRIKRSTTPTLAGVEALVLVYGTFLVQFAVLYVAVSVSDQAAFDEVLNRVGGLYLSITVLSTVGFGDITPASDLARILVSIQMIADIVLIGTAFRILSTTARKAAAVVPPEVAS